MCVFMCTCTYIIASRNIADWWLAYWISHSHKPYLYFDNNDNHSSVALFLEGELPAPQNENNDTHFTNLTAAGDNLAFYLGIYGGLATANSVRYITLGYCSNTLKLGNH